MIIIRLFFHVTNVEIVKLEDQYSCKAYKKDFLANGREFAKDHLQSWGKYLHQTKEIQ